MNYSKAGSEQVLYCFLTSYIMLVSKYSDRTTQICPAENHSKIFILRVLLRF